MLPLVVATIGHAAWDNILHWMIKQDPDASLLHMHWIRMVFVCLFLSALSFRQTPTKHTIYWWCKFSICGWVIPTISYTICVILSGYRIAISLQPLIPLFVAFHVSKIEGWRLLALNFALLGTLAIWLIAPWSHREIFLWQIWGSVLAGGLQVISTVTWFLMMEKENVLANITRGVQISVLIMFVSTIIWTPQHLNAVYMSKWDNWLCLIIAAALSSTCKMWVIVQFSNQMSTDSIAIFECLHPIATLCTDIIFQNEIFEFNDSLAIILLSIGWILYPKTNI